MYSKFTRQEMDRNKDYARMLFVRDLLTQEEVSQKTGVHFVTINRWVAQGSWKKLQRNFLLTRQEQLAYLQDELAQITASIRSRADGKQFADPKEADVRHKLVRDIKDLETDASLSEIISSSKNLLLFIRKIDLAKGQELTGWIDKYIKTLL